MGKINNTVFMYLKFTNLSSLFCPCNLVLHSVLYCIRCLVCPNVTRDNTRYGQSNIIELHQPMS
jgi:hypothetical protein